MYYDVIIKSKTSFLDNLFTYKSDEDISKGSRVIVPFGRGNAKRLAFVMNKKNRLDKDIRVKEIAEVIDYKPIINQELFSLLDYMVNNNLSDYSSAIQVLMPPGGFDEVIEYFKTSDDNKDQAELYDYLREARPYEEIKLDFPNVTRSYLNQLVDSGKLVSQLDKKSLASKKYVDYIELLEENPKLRSNAIKQRAIVDFLRENGESEKNYLRAMTDSSLSSINSLADKKIIKINRHQVFRNVLNPNIKKKKPLKLTHEQEGVFKEILNSKDKYFLLHGITGSGKTEIYLQLVEKCIEKGRQAIILVPEISLTPQTIKRFQERFGNRLAVLHSKLSPSERFDQWSLIKNSMVDIVVGARSAVFAPFDRLGLIVIDEEHESTYKSDKNPKYNAIDIAVERIKNTGGKLVMGTATPSIDSMYRAYEGEFRLLRLNERANKSSLPEVEIVDMREELKANNFSMFSTKLKDYMEEALRRKQQIILFLNKRGHTSFVFCRTCGYVYRCKACDVSMTYHKNLDRLICHYCGRTAKKSRTCPNCGSTYIKEFGAGTQLLEEETKKLFPEARIFRMDADTTRNKDSYDRVYRKMVDKEIDILIGTQMLAKGFDFPNVTLVGIMAADIGLNLPDYRAGEKTFQLLTQVSGRAGRGKDKGHVIIQTYKPENYAIAHAKDANYYGFFKDEVNKRKRFSYPPFENILVVNLSSKNRYKSLEKARSIKEKILAYSRDKELALGQVKGPTPSVIERINNYYRFNVIVKSKNIDDLLDVAKFIKKQEERDSDVYINFNINPDSLN